MFQSQWGPQGHPAGPREDRREDLPQLKGLPPFLQYRRFCRAHGLCQGFLSWADFSSSRSSCLGGPVLRLPMLTDATRQLLSGNLVVLLYIIIPRFVYFH